MDGNGGPVTNVTAARLFNGTRSAADIYYSGLSSLPIVNLFETTIIDFTGGVAPITNQPSVIRIEGGPSDVLTTLNGTTAGTAVSSEPTISPTKKTFRIYLKGYENTTATAQTIAIPVAFATAMSSVDTVSGTCLGVTATTTMVRLPSSMTGTQTGLCEFAGY